MFVVPGTLLIVVGQGTYQISSWVVIRRKNDHHIWLAKKESLFPPLRNHKSWPVCCIDGFTVGLCQDIVNHKKSLNCRRLFFYLWFDPSCSVQLLEPRFAKESLNLSINMFSLINLECVITFVILSSILRLTQIVPLKAPTRA